MIKTQLASDKFAMTISMACVAHCFFTPTFLILTSGLFSFSFDNEFVHKLIVLIAVPVSIYALSLGYKNHKETSYFIIGITGLMVLLSAVLFSDTLFGEAGERALTLIGSMIVAFAHYKNHSICKQIECDCHDNLKSN